MKFKSRFFTDIPAWSDPQNSGIFIGIASYDVAATDKKKFCPKKVFFYDKSSDLFKKNTNYSIITIKLSLQKWDKET